jgi:hypothetical protein
MPNKRTPDREDVNQIARRILQEATEDDATDDEEARKLAARLLGRRGGLKGGPARAKALSKKRRSEIARKAAEARWKKKR